jgi:tRNA-dependent cyclodipeptide synthase
MSGFEIQETLGIAAEEILAKRHNLFVGASDTPWFREGTRFEELIVWALEKTCESLLVCIPGRLYSSNAFHISKKSRADALQDGYRLEDEFRERVQAVVSRHLLSSKAHVIGYDELQTHDFVRRKEALYRAFGVKQGFYKRVIDVAKDYLRLRNRPVDDRRAEAIAVYQLQELPIFVAALGTIDSAATYSAVIYPGFGKFDLLAHDLATGDKFPEIPGWFKPKTSMGIASVKLVE